MTDGKTTEATLVRSMWLRQSASGREFERAGGSIEAATAHIDAFCVEHGLSWTMETEMASYYGSGANHAFMWLTFTKAVTPQPQSKGLEDEAYEFGMLLSHHIFQGAYLDGTVLLNGDYEVTGDAMRVGYDT